MSDTRVACFLGDDAVVRVTLARGDEGNGIDMAMVEGLVAAVDQCERVIGLGEARAVLIGAEGPSFTVGGDLAHIGGEVHRLADELVAMIEPFHDALARFAELEAPVVCAAQGPAAGGGIGLLWCADLVIAADDLRLVTGFAALGLSGDGGSTFYLPRLAGTRRALAAYLENRPIAVAEALELGLVSRVVPRAELAAVADETARRLAAGPTVALAQMRALLRGSGTRTLREQLAAELDAMRVTGASQDAPRAISAFVARERPRFEGR